MRAERLILGASAVAAMLWFAGCAARTPVPVAAAPAYPDFVYPAVPAALQGQPGVERVEAGWRLLQSDDLRAAEREFAATLKRNPAMYPALAGQGYVELARRSYQDARHAFDRALAAARDYPAALVGRGYALLGEQQDAPALAAFEAALAADPSLNELTPRVEVLRFRIVRAVIEQARRAAAAGRLEEARTAYERALAQSPDSVFLYREIGAVERRQGNAAAALAHFRRGLEIDPADVMSLVQTAAILLERQDFAGADAALRRAAAVEPSADLTARLAEVAERWREATLPAEFQRLPSAGQVTRGDLAALVGVRLEPLLRGTPGRQAVMTDTRGHWALPWITEVARAGVMEPFENHTFQPDALVRRGDLAAVVNRLIALASATNPTLAKRAQGRVEFADLSPGHVSYPAAAVAVATGVMPLRANARFDVSSAVSGAEAVETIERVRRWQSGQGGPGA